MEEKYNQEEDAFYEEDEIIIQESPRDDTKIIVGDFSDKIGREKEICQL